MSYETDWESLAGVKEDGPYTAQKHGWCEVCSVVIYPGDEVVTVTGVEIHASCQETDVPTPMKKRPPVWSRGHVVLSDLIGGAGHQAFVRGLYES